MNGGFFASAGLIVVILLALGIRRWAIFGLEGFGGLLGNTDRQTIRLRFGSVLILMLVLCNPALAQQKEFEKCGSIEDNESRLKCFDQLLVEKKRHTKSIVADNVSQWSVENLVDPIDDSIDSFASLKAVKVEGSEDVPFFVLNCDKDKKMYAWINWRRPVRVHWEPDLADVVVRVRDEVAFNTRWAVVSTTGTAYRWTYGRPDLNEFVRALRGGGRLLFRVESRTGNYITAFFQIDGLDTALKRLKNVCEW